MSAAREAGAYQRKLNEENEQKIIKKLRDNGVEVIEEINTAPFKQAIEKDVRKSFIEKNGNKLVKQIDAAAP